MPRAHRSSAAGAAPETRPAFARPPGARGPSAARNVSTERRTPTTPTKKTNRPKAKESPATTPKKSGERRKSHHATNRGVESSPTKPRAKYNSGTSSGESTQVLSLDSLAKLNALNEKSDIRTKEVYSRKEREKERERKHRPDGTTARRKRKHRDVSGALLEEGRAEKVRQRTVHRGGGSEIYERMRHRGGDADDGRNNKKKWLCLAGAFIVLVLIIVIPVGVVVAKKHHKDPSDGATTTATTSTGNLPDGNTVPAAAKNTYLDPYTWLDTTDFNTTYTNDTVGGLSVMGLNMTWDDTARANPTVPALNQTWTYGERPIRGVNLGGWLDLEPFITPSLFNSYSSSEGIIDEYTLVTKLGQKTAAQTLEKHYATFVTEQTFSEIAAAGLDHVRIPYPYWAVTTYDGDPYVPKTAWRYLLRGIEWARKYGLRINLDLHSLPGSQNGWNHSGHQGPIDWLNGTDGSLNAQRSLDIHRQLATFFAQPRYDNVIQFYGLVNEPHMLALPIEAVVNWNIQAVKVIRDSGLKKYLPFGDGFLALNAWHGNFTGVDDKLVMDTHQYMIFNAGEVAFTHQNKISLACDTWSKMLVASEDASSTGWGPLLDGEWSQADTDCQQYVNNVGVGNRWEGTLDNGDPSTQVLTPRCPYENSTCSCSLANADPSDYSDQYRSYLLMLAEAQMFAFEQIWGWFYWTWDTESAPQWSYKKGLAAGIMPKLAYDRSFLCNSSVPDFAAEGLPEYY